MWRDPSPPRGRPAPGDVTCSGSICSRVSQNTSPSESLATWLPSRVSAAGASPPPGREAHGSAAGGAGVTKAFRGSRSPAQAEGSRAASGHRAGVCVHKAGWQEEAGALQREAQSSVNSTRTRQQRIAHAPGEETEAQKAKERGCCWVSTAAGSLNSPSPPCPMHCRASLTSPSTGLSRAGLCARPAPPRKEAAVS